MRSNVYIVTVTNAINILNKIYCQLLSWIEIISFIANKTTCKVPNFDAEQNMTFTVREFISLTKVCAAIHLLILLRQQSIVYNTLPVKYISYFYRYTYETIWSTHIIVQ